jgi:hypothetical protein
VKHLKADKRCGGLQFYDIDMLKMFHTDVKKLNWTRPYNHESGGYSIICYNQDYNDDVPDEDTVERFSVCKDCALLHELLCKFYKKNDQEGIMVMTNTDDDADSTSTSSEHTA